MSDIDLAKVKRNVATMVEKKAPESDIDKYISDSGTNIDAVKNFKPQAEAPEQQTSAARTALEQGEQGATFGFSDEIMNLIGAGYAHLITGEPFSKLHQEATDETTERMAAQQKQHPYISGASQVGGALGAGIAGASTRVGKALASNIKNSPMLAKIGKSMLLGGAGGALSGAGTAKPGQRLEGAQSGAALGAATGGAFAGAGQVASSVIAPKFTAAVKLLKDAGVKLTPGQMAKGTVETLKRAESALGSIPFVGNTVRSAMKNSMESFNTAILNKALAPVGEKMPKNIVAGREAIAHAESVIGSKYDKLAPKLNFQMDNQFLTDFKQFEQDTLHKMSPEMQKTFNNKFKSITEHRLDKNLGIDGENFKKVESELGYEARNYLSNHNASPQERELGNALQQVQGVLRDNLERMNPQFSKELKKINESWAMFKRAQGASIRRTGSGGVFSPTDLAADIKKSTSKGAFARGDGLLQDLADAGIEVMPSSIPDSGTLERALWSGAALKGATMLNPKTAIPTAAAAGLYTKPGIAMAHKIASPGPTRELMRQAVEGGIAPAAAVGGAQAGMQPLQNNK